MFAPGMTELSFHESPYLGNCKMFIVESLFGTLIFHHIST